MIWILAVAAGSAGAGLRFVVGSAVQRRAKTDAPIGTAAVNLTGAGLLGIIAGLDLPAGAALVIGSGLIGAFTTYSTWMVETLLLLNDERVGRAHAAANLALQAGAGLVLAAAGLALGRLL
ncbi:MAG: CrcB family protein [Acidimicrobiia bacterium]|nr:CrcB family protein [Acidimicrobiia bacterium]